MRGLTGIVGPHYVNVVKAGKYRISLRQAPEVAAVKLRAVHAKLEIAGVTAEAPIPAGVEEINFDLELPAGQTQLLTYMTDEKGKVSGSTFVVVEAL